jgi:hypothetical protein
VGSLTIGLDIGQRVDPTALAVAEADWREGAQSLWAAHFLVRYLDRLPLGTPYPAVAVRLHEVALRAGQRGKSTPRLYLDATGVGTPVFDALKAARVPADIVPCYFNHGDRRTHEVSAQGGGMLESVRIGKAWLVSRLQVLLQEGRLHLPKTAEADVLAKELLDYEIRVDQDANDKYGAFKVGTHDDLVTALGLACQEDPRVSRRGVREVSGLRV